MAAKLIMGYISKVSGGGATVQVIITAGVVTFMHHVLYFRYNLLNII